MVLHARWRTGILIIQAKPDTLSLTVFCHFTLFFHLSLEFHYHQEKVLFLVDKRLLIKLWIIMNKKKKTFNRLHCKWITCNLEIIKRQKNFNLHVLSTVLCSLGDLKMIKILSLGGYIIHEVTGNETGTRVIVKQVRRDIIPNIK